MANEGSVSQWLGQLQAGDRAAAQQLWERYFRRLVGFARQKLQGTPRRVADEEDVALSAFASFCRSAERGRFPQLLDRDNLWRLLVVITARKAFHQGVHEGRKKRGGGAAFAAATSADPHHSGFGDSDLECVLDREPTPAFAAQVAEECQRLLGMLGDADLQSVALWKMEGYSTEEIAAKLGCVPRTVERKWRVIRGLWEQVESRP